MTIPTLEHLHALGAAQQPHWPDQGALDSAVATLRSMPPLVFAGECDDLKGHSRRWPPARRSCCRAATAPRPSTA